MKDTDLKVLSSSSQPL